MSADYNITISSEPLAAIQSLLKDSDYNKILVLVDNNTLKHCYPLIGDGLSAHETVTIPSGEPFKSLETCTTIWSHMTSAKLDRKSLLINLGGGVIGDMGGFCAATYKRGIDFINLPTTLLSQVDASIGGKLGIDFQGYKNHIGLFRNPKKVIIHPGFLGSLPENELRSGYAEVIKHCLIADAGYWDKLTKTNWDQQPWEAIIEHSIEVKTTITRQDPHENGLRKILNFGHTIGHAAESFFLESLHPILHGEAVALGMIAESYLSTTRSGLSTEQQNQIVDYISSIYKKIDLDDESIERISELITQDKKNEADQIKASLLEKIGKAVYDITITTAEVREALQFYKGVGQH